VTQIEQPSAGVHSEHEALRYRLHQQSLLADFSREALRCRQMEPLLDSAAEVGAQGLEADFSKVLQYRPERDTLLLRAGVGWRPGLVGVVETPATEDNAPGYCFKCGDPVIADQQSPDQRFNTFEFMLEQGITRAINVPVDIDGKRFGVLEVDSRDASKFVADDIAFLQALANLLGLAVGRIEVERSLERANQHQQLLTREVSHRVKNSLALVSALISLRSRSIDDPALQQIMGDMQGRIQTIARAHDLLWRGDRVGTVPLDAMICELAEELVGQAPGHRLDCKVAEVEIDADTAIPIGLMVTELVTNALKYAYGPEGGSISVELADGGDQLSLAVRDWGRGLPAGTMFDGKGGSSLGSRIVASTARQLRGRLELEREEPGTAIRFTMPKPEPRVR
jgi:two-component sensor histidine kinase